MKGTDKTKRQEGNNNQDRFYASDIIKNKITNKVLKVDTVVMRADGNGILYYWLCDIDDYCLCDIDDELSLNRSILQEAFVHWELVVSKSIQPDCNATKGNGVIMMKPIVI